MPRSTSILIAALLTALAAPATALGGITPPRAQPLERGWELRVGRSLEPNARDWRRVTVPNVFDPSPDASDAGGTIAWYRTSFRGPAAPAAFTWALRFESVRRQATVYLNGRRVGANDDPYTPFELQASGLRAGRSNELVVRVSNKKGRDPREGWWNWGGITRPVSLVPQGRITTTALGLLPRLAQPTGGDATVTVDALVRNVGRRALAPRLEVALSSPTGTTTTKTFRLARLRPGTARQERLALRVPDVALWSPKSPQLYDATVRTLAGNRVEQVDRLRIGMRSVQVRDGLLYLNGQRMSVRGAAMHEDWPGRGAALTDADVEGFVEDLKALGATVTRTHYLFDERLLRRFDEAGILVWNESPVWARDDLLKQAAGRRDALAQLKRTIVAARNHPSVFTNSVANELSTEPDTRPGTRAYLEQGAALARRLAPDTPVSLAIISGPGFPRQSIYDDFDLIGFNAYFGWYPGRAGHETPTVEGLDPFIRELRSKYPRQALVMSEFGAEASRDGPATKRDTYGFQTDWIRRTLDIVDAHPELGGAIYWALRDFAVKPRWDGGAQRPASQRTSIFHKGLLGYEDRKPKPAWELVRSRFARFIPN